jgi:hypothetical protein
MKGEATLPCTYYIEGGAMMLEFGNRRRIVRLENKVIELLKENKELQKSLKEKRKFYDPQWGKEITVSPYVFERYIKHIGRPTLGGYLVYCEDGTSYTVNIDEEMSDGYIRFEQAFEEPHGECKYCSKFFKLFDGYPKDSPDFCSHDCYNRFLKET